MRALPLLILCSAACATPYQARGFAGGFSDNSLGGNRYAITFHGNGYTSGSTVRQYVLRRAHDLCQEHQFDSFRVLDGGDYADTSYTVQRSGGGATVDSTTKHDSQVVVECESSVKAAEPARRPAQARVKDDGESDDRPPPSSAACRSAYEHIDESADMIAVALTDAGRTHHVLEDSPQRADFLRVCNSLPEQSQICLGVAFHRGHRAECRAEFSALSQRARLRLERLFFRAD